MSGGGQVEFVRLTGQPAARTALEEVPFVPDKRFQLLTYLAYDGGWVGRERAAFLFWPDSDTSTSRQNLRGLLQRLHTLPFEPGVEATKHQLRWQVPTDVAAFNEAIRRGEVARALAAYQGPLLKELETDDEGEFAEWLEIEREQLYSRWRGLALGRLAQLAPGDAAEAADLLRRLLDADPLDEEAVRAYVQAATRLGRPADATRAYRELAARLEREMGLEPTSDTTAAYEAALAAEASAPSVRPPAPAGDETRPATPRPAVGAGQLAPERAPRRIPTPTTSFVGREAEVQEVVARLRDPACRLLSLIGPGGVGKTRLALAVAARLAGDLEGGVAFVPLDSVSSVDEVVPAIAGALGLGRGSEADTWRQLTGLLSDADLLLVIDNFEHVLGAAGVLPRLLAAGEGVKILVTTRERLGLEAEWTYLVDGLDYPAAAVPLASLPHYGAAQLLLERARRVRPGFSFSEDDLPALERLFALTDGLPLAIELAAAWLRAVPLATLVPEIERDPGALTVVTSDATPRHGSIRAVFEQSWSRLTDAERAVMRRLAVFAGSVTPEAAAFVAGANRVVLGALVDKSLLRLGDDGRYDTHPLLLTLAREKLVADPSEQRGVELRHTAYHLRFLRERTDRAKGPRPALVQQEVHAEMREVRAAMRRAAERGTLAELVAFMQLLEHELGYFQAHGHDDETLELLSRAAEAAEAAGDLGVARDLRGRVGDAYGINRGDTDRALREYRRAAGLARRSGNVAREAVFVGLCGVMERIRNASAGQEELDRALELARVSEDPVAVSHVLEHRAYAHMAIGDPQGARSMYLQSLQAVESLSDPESVHPFELARRRYYATVNLGDTDRQLGRFDDALARRKDALRIAREMGNQLWEAHAHLELGEMYGEAGQHEAGRDHLRLARALYLDNHVTAQLGRIAEIVERHGYDLSD